MNNEVIVDKTGEDAIVNETKQAESVADYNVYLKLSKMKYSHQQIADHMSITTKQLDAILDQFEGGTE